MKCLSTLEWNKTQFDRLCSKYQSLVENDMHRDSCVRNLPSSLSAERILIIDIHQQILLVVANGVLEKTYAVSTAFNGAGSRENSGCTPLGWHRIEQKIGSDEPVGSIFKGRRITGIAGTLVSPEDDDLITSRILWLSGVQPGVNSGGGVDTHSRYIYIHGTAQEHLIGQAVSHGCIRMRNDEVIELFEQVEEKTVVVICHHLGEYLDQP